MLSYGIKDETMTLNAETNHSYILAILAAKFRYGTNCEFQKVVPQAKEIKWEFKSINNMITV